MMELLGQFSPGDWSVATVLPQCWYPCSFCPCKCLFMNWIFLLTAWIMTHSNYVTSSFSSHRERLRKVVGGFVWGFFMSFCCLTSMWLLLLWGFIFSSLWKGGYFFYIFLNPWEIEPFLWSVLSAYHTTLYTSVNLCVSSCCGTFFPPWVLFSVSNSVCFEAFLFTQFSLLFLSLTVILVSSPFSNRGL